MSTHSLMLDGVLLCNASIRLVACYASYSMATELWLLIEIVLNAQKRHILWHAAKLDKLNLE